MHPNNYNEDVCCEAVARTPEIIEQVELLYRNTEILEKLCQKLWEKLRPVTRQELVAERVTGIKSSPQTEMGQTLFSNNEKIKNATESISDLIDLIEL
jgi:hypothetical protein